MSTKFVQVIFFNYCSSESILDVALLQKYFELDMPTQVRNTISNEADMPMQMGHNILLEYITMQIVLHNANSSGGVVNITKEVVDKAT